MSKLTSKQRRFVPEYLIDGNGAQAAIRAGYSPNRANDAAQKLLKNPEIKARIEKAQAARIKRIEITADQVLKELARIAFSDIGKVFDEEGLLLPIHSISEDARRVITSVECDEIFEWEDGKKVHTGYKKKLKFADKTKALELLGKHFKLYTDRIEHDTTDKLAEALQAARKRVNDKRS